MTMTVRELKTSLDGYPDEMPVVAVWEGCGAGFRIENFEVVQYNADEPQLCINVENYG